MTRAGFDTQGTFFPEQLPNVKENGWVKWFVRSDLFALYNRTTLARLWSHPADIFRGHLKQLGCVSNLFAFPGSSNTIELNEWLSMAKLMRVVQKRWLKESVGAVNTTLIADPITADLYRRSGPVASWAHFAHFVYGWWETTDKRCKCVEIKEPMLVERSCIPGWKNLSLWEKSWELIGILIKKANKRSDFKMWSVIQMSQQITSYTALILPVAE